MNSKRKTKRKPAKVQFKDLKPKGGPKGGMGGNIFPGFDKLRPKVP
jgi:hypothetical protein